jgi:hypothetical protein
MAPPRNPTEGCRHDRSPLRRLGKVTHQRTGRPVYVLMCTECGFTVTTDQLRRLRREAAATEQSPAAEGHMPGFYANLTG